MVANDFILNVLQDCKLQVFTEKVLRYVLRNFKKRIFSVSFFRLSRFKIADALACESNNSLAHPLLIS